MANLKRVVLSALRQMIIESFGDQIGEDFDPSTIEVTQSTQPQFGHYQTNFAMKMSKQLRQNPKKIAEKLLEAFDGETYSALESMDVKGPGFINITLKSTFLSQAINALSKDAQLGIEPPTKKEKVIVEFSSPNVAKELHVGHLRSTIIGESIARLFEFLGHDVLRLNHIGDWGTQFGMLIHYLKTREESVLKGEKEATLSQLMGWYRSAKALFDKDPDFKKASQQEVVALQGGDKVALGAWKRICAISSRGFNSIYALLDVSGQERGESFYNRYLAKMVQIFEDKGLLEVSDGAKCVFLEGFKNKEGDPLPLILQKSDGGYNYATTDVAALYHRVNEEKADRIIYVVDSGQSLHFQMIFAACKKAGILDEKKVRVEHVPFGVVLGEDGKKFKTRSGKTEKLIDLLTEAVSRASKVLAERMDSPKPGEVEVLGKVLGLDAIKYADLSCHRIKDYVFSYDKMLKFEGNTAAYLLYSYVRIQGIKRKIQNVEKLLEGAEITLEHPSETALALHLLRFGESLQMMDKDLLPNRLTDYLYDLAEAFHAFFRDCHVQGSEHEASRLKLCVITASMLEQGMQILGMKTLDKM
ncbi:arginine--tRNA ligase [Candidatus Aerophobetes bacterium]|uniref:Arginine--tRNA ligase n=1 Tax=Aerophobetes bacterium TaxID=2030807 RepID=A0A2A4WZT3_UNCAE|nr:MAG: arginine--tRNA ligase [Candidatus Aerophobetes bacterium]